MRKTIHFRGGNWREIPFLMFSGLSILMLLQCCAIHIAPKYDVKIVDSLSESSNNLFTFFSEVSEGTTALDYSVREQKYNALIGKLEALELQIKARPVPSSSKLEKLKEKVNGALKARNVDAFQFSTDDNFPSANALKMIVLNIKKLKDVDKLQGVSKTEVQVFKGYVENYLDQALTYEKYLNPKF